MRPTKLLLATTLVAALFANTVLAQEATSKAIPATPAIPAVESAEPAESAMPAVEAPVKEKVMHKKHVRKHTKKHARKHKVEEMKTMPEATSGTAE